MKVLQTLGRYKKNKQEGIFQYKRTEEAVHIDLTVGQAGSIRRPTIKITTDEWQSILREIRGNRSTYFRIRKATTSAHPKQSLREAFKSAVPRPADGWTWNDVYVAYVAAILEHEGSLDLYGGPLGRGNGAPIVLAADL